jgi:hypothetical protein
MNDLTKRVEQWYRENREKIGDQFSKAEFHDKTDWDAIRGAVNIELESSGPAWLTITVWNKGDISAGALKDGWKEAVWIEDRVLGPTEDIVPLLDSLLERFSELVQSPR